MFDVISVGNLTIDSILLPYRGPPTVTMGGSAVYASIAARLLDVTVSIISKVGADFPDGYLWQLKQYGIDLSGLVKAEDARTTCFRLQYSDDLLYRELQLGARAPPITLEDLHECLKAKVIHVAPVAGEITYEVAKKLRGCARKLSLDPQGLLRVFNEGGSVSLNSLADECILELVDIFKSSSEEIKTLTGKSDLRRATRRIHDYGVQTVIVTLGDEGALLSVDDTIYEIPVCKPSKLVDPTGAGDVFIGAFLAEYLRGKSILWSGYVGSAAASLIVETAGPVFSGGKTEIYQRAKALYEKRN